MDRHRLLEHCALGAESSPAPERTGAGRRWRQSWRHRRQHGAHQRRALPALVVDAPTYGLGCGLDHVATQAGFHSTKEELTMQTNTQGPRLPRRAHLNSLRPRTMALIGVAAVSLSLA